MAVKLYLMLFALLLAKPTCVKAADPTTKAQTNMTASPTLATVSRPLITVGCPKQGSGFIGCFDSWTTYLGLYSTKSSVVKPAVPTSGEFFKTACDANPDAFEDCLQSFFASAADQTIPWCGPPSTSEVQVCTG